MALAKVHLYAFSQQLQKGFSSEITGPLSIKFHMQPSGKVGKSLYIWSWSHEQNDSHAMLI